MDFTINRDKNYISFLADGKNKPYVFDINTGILYSIQSKPLKRLPPKFKTCVHYYSGTNNMVFALMDRIIYDPYQYSENWSFNLSLFAENAELFRTADKLSSLGYVCKNRADVNKNNLTIVNENFKAFAKYFNDNKKNSVSSFVHEMYPLIWAKKHNVEENEIFTLDVIRTLINSYFTEEQTDYIIRCMCRGVCYFFINKDGGFDYRSMLDRFKKYFDMCAQMDLPYEKDFFRSYINANRMYQIHKMHLDNKAIVNNYKNRNLLFEDENFTVVIPQTVDDFKKEATHQNNCVYSCYLREVVNHRTNVVFIRRKENIEDSYITCEVSNNGNIRQFLLKYNTPVKKDTPEKEFYHKYAQWLKENWV